MRKFILTLSVLACAVVCALPVGAQVLPAPDANSVVILSTTVTGGLGSVEAVKAAAIPRTVVLASPAQWVAMTAADFASYRAIILGDPTCQFSGPEAAATATGATWGPQVNGNVVIWGTDPVFHQGQGGDVVTDTGVRFASDLPTKTGAYITLSCYHHGAAPGTPVPLLNNAFGPGFTVTGVGCYNDAHIVATSPALTGLTDAVISNWSCSVHEAFDNWPVTFDVLAIARGIGASYNAPDGSIGTPYVIARGVTLISNLDLTPDEDTNELGETHTVTACVTEDGVPVVGTKVEFFIDAGPHAGLSGSDFTDATGCATFSYVGVALGDDIIRASYVDAAGATQFDRAIKHWVAPSNNPPDCSNAQAAIEVIWPPNHKFTAVSIIGVTDPDGDDVTITVTSISQDEPINTFGDGSTCPDGIIMDGAALVRVERSGTPSVPGNGRVYHITFIASDGDDTCEGVVTVCVPHDQGNGDVCVDDGPLYNSLGPCKGGARKGDDGLALGTEFNVRTESGQSHLEYTLADEVDVNLSVFDVSGRRMATIENTRKGAGSYAVTWESTLARGMYFYRLQAGNTVVTKTVLHAE
jgi:hypothetical protein